MYEDSELEDVHTVDDWYGGPRTGFAQYHGRPRHYRSLYLDNDEWDADEDRFELVPVSADVLAAALEASAIFNRWDSARKRGEIAWTGEAPSSEFGALAETATVMPSRALLFRRTRSPGIRTVLSSAVSSNSDASAYSGGRTRSARGNTSGEEATAAGVTIRFVAGSAP